MKEHKLDVVVPVRNCPTKVFRLLDTLLSEIGERNDVGVIIVDDCSDDETPQKMDRFVANRKDEIFRIKHLTDRRCIGGARNAGVAESSASYIMFADADDDLEEGIIGDILKTIDEKSPEMIIWGFDSIHAKIRTRWMPDVKAHTIESFPVGAWFKAIKRDLFVNFQEGVFCEDCVWWFLQVDKVDPGKIELLNRVGYLYDRRDETFSNAIVYLKNNPTSLETLAFEDTLVKKRMNDRCPSDVLRCLADMYDARKMLKRKETKLAWANRFSDMYKNIMTSRWAY